MLTGEVALRARELIRQSCMSRDIKILQGHVSVDHVH
ncbi:MAG: transposase, partial [Anaerolineae bacterium]|nr:transposase [Anaerolineae bacterium]